MSGPRTDAGKVLAEWLEFARGRGLAGVPLAGSVTAVEIGALRMLRQELDRTIEMAEAEPPVDPRYRNTAGWVEGWIDGVKAIRDELAKLDPPAAAT